MNDMQNFSNLKNRAINEMLKMNEKASKTTDLKEDNQAKKEQIKHKKTIFDIFFSNDELLILALVLILSKDCNDYWLFLALLYILT